MYDNMTLIPYMMPKLRDNNINVNYFLPLHNDKSDILVIDRTAGENTTLGVSTVGRYKSNIKINNIAFIGNRFSIFETIETLNTNIKKWEFVAYSQAAHALGYQVKEVVVGEIKDKSLQHLYAKRNTHNVALRTISKMAYMFEW